MVILGLGTWETNEQSSPTVWPPNGVCEQHVTYCLMVTQTRCDPGAGAMGMDLRGSEHTSAMLDWVEPTGRMPELVLVMPT